MESEQKKNSYNHILKYTGLFGGVQGLAILVGVIRNKLVALLLGPDGMGIISLFNSTVKLLSDSTNMGIPMSGVKNISQYFDDNHVAALNRQVKMIRSLSLFTGLVGMVLCMVLSPLLGRYSMNYGNHVMHYVCLAPVVLLTALMGGEMAILKGVRQLKPLAKASVANIVAATLISLPLYFVWGISAIVPSLVLVALAEYVITARLSFAIFPLRLMALKPALHTGWSMLKLGISFVLAGVMGSGADFLIRAFLSKHAGFDVVGLYSAGYTITMQYAGLVFAAMETDYFPRLSGIRAVCPKLSATVNSQIEVTLLLLSPLLVAFMIGAPLLLPLLYSHKFIPVLAMVQITVLAMYVRAFKLPMAYLPLAQGHSGIYLLLESIYDVAVTVFVVVGYLLGGLSGTGVALLSASVFDMIVILIVTRYKYHYHVSRQATVLMLIQSALGVLALGITFCHSGWMYWCGGLLVFLMSSAVSIWQLRRNSDILQTLKNKINRKFNG